MSIAGCKEGSEPVAEPEAHAFIGTWIIDYDRSLEEAKNSPDYTPAAAEKMPAFIKKLMEQMKLQITDSEIVYMMGENRQAMAYTIESQTATSLVANAHAGENRASMNFTLIDGQYMNLKSSASDDMTYYIWKPDEQADTPSP